MRISVHDRLMYGPINTGYLITLQQQKKSGMRNNAKKHCVQSLDQISGLDYWTHSKIRKFIALPMICD